jgi:NDP-sugar pyrophosphorylase family protein
MQAVILAGGLGTRLKLVTQQIPKVMVPVNGKPFLLHLLELLTSQGINDVVICIGYKGEQIKNFFGNGTRFGLRIYYSEEKEELLGTGGALKQAQGLLERHCFVVNGDTYLPISYGDIESYFIRRGKKTLMVVYDNKKDTGVKNNVELDSNLMVIRHEKGKTDPSLRHVEAGVLVLSREALDIIKEVHSVSLEVGLYPILIKQRELAAYITKQRFYDIGTPEQLETFEEYLQQKPR